MGSREEEVVRHPIAGSRHPKRHPEARLLLRLPWLRAVLTRWMSRLPPASRLRQALLRRTMRVTLDASNREDLEVTFMFWAPDCESAFPREMASLGDPGVRGRDDRIRWEAKWRAEWGQVNYVPDEMIDCGEKVVVTGRLRGSGAGSGAAVDTDWALLVEFGPEGVTREEVFFDRAPALKAVGLSE